MSTIRYRPWDGDMLPLGSPEGSRLLLESLTIESNEPRFWEAVAEQSRNNAAVLRQRDRTRRAAS